MESEESTITQESPPADSRVCELEARIRQLELTEQRFRSLLESAPDAIVIVDSMGQIAMVNAQTEQIFGYSREELIGQSIETLVPERFRGIHRHHRAAYAERPHTREMGAGVELFGRRRDGSEFPAEISLSPRRTEEGDLVFCAIRDITRRKLAEQALRESEERFDLAVRGTDAGIWDWDLRSGRLYLSPRWKGMLGYEDGEIAESFAEWETRLHPADRQRALTAVQDYLAGKTDEYELEHRLKHKDGSYRWILARGAAVRDASGTPYRMVGSHIDITELKDTLAVLHDRDVQMVAAQQIQKHLLPQRPPEVPGIDVLGASFPAEFAAGDHFDYFLMPDGALAVVIGDVTGHGFGPALIMASVHTLIRALSQRYCDVSDILHHANRFLCEETAEHFFATVLFARIDTGSRRLEYASAGHPPAYVFDRQGAIKARLESTGIPLGIYLNETTPMGSPVDLDDGDLVFMLTDGAIEIRSPGGEPFGVERAIDCVRRHREKPPAEIIEQLYRAVVQFSQKESPDDDVTAVVLKIGPRPAEREAASDAEAVLRTLRNGEPAAGV